MSKNKNGFWKKLLQGFMPNIPKVMEETAESIYKNVLTPSIGELKDFVDEKVQDKILQAIINDKIEQIETAIKSKIDDIYKEDNQ